MRYGFVRGAPRRCSRQEPTCDAKTWGVAPSKSTLARYDSFKAAADALYPPGPAAKTGKATTPPVAKALAMATLLRPSFRLRRKMFEVLGEHASTHDMARPGAKCAIAHIRHHARTNLVASGSKFAAASLSLIHI